VRIIGECGGLLLKCPKIGRATTPDLFARLFSTAWATVEGARVLDLFSGCGALGLNVSVAEPPGSSA